MYTRAYKFAVTAPPLIWIMGLLVVPYIMLFCYSFWSVSPDQVIVKTWTLQNYRQLIANPMYFNVLIRSFKIAGIVTLVTIILGFPLAYFIAFHTSVRRELLYQLVIVPLWVSYLVRGYAWKTILGSEGVLNGFLQYLGLTDAPLEFLLYSPFAVVLTLVHIYTPFTFLPIYAALAQIPKALIEASSDLGATPGKTFLRVILPLAAPGLIAGATFTFVLTLGDFLAPLLVGGSSGIMISNIVVSLFGAAFNWPLGAAISLVLLLMVLFILKLTARWEMKTP
jgi:spermidine/putrescine transport system permease protein